MSDQSGLQTCEASRFAEKGDAEFSRPSPTSFQAGGQASVPPAKAPLDQSSLANRIRDNLNWAHAFDPQACPFPPVDVWQDVKPLWAKSDKEFVTGLYEVLLGRPPEPAGLEMACAGLASGDSRVALARAVALSDEASAAGLDLSWLPRLEEVESDAVWEKVESLWDESDHVFVESLYPLLLVRPPDPVGVVAHCRAMKTGASRASVVRAFALSDEAQSRGIRTSWLARLEILPAPSPPPTPPRLLSLHWLKKAFRRWRDGNSSAPPANPPQSKGTRQPTGAAAEGGRA